CNMNWRGQSAGYFLAKSRRGPYRSSQDWDKSDMEGKARYSASMWGASAQAVRLDCAHNADETTARRARVRMEATFLVWGDCSTRGGFGFDYHDQMPFSSGKPAFSRRTFVALAPIAALAQNRNP